MRRTVRPFQRDPDIPERHPNARGQWCPPSFWEATLAAFLDTTQADVDDRAVHDQTVRHADVIEKGIANARSALAGGDSAIVALLLNEPAESIERVSGGRRNG
jgi:hypothetical protein